MNVWVRLVIFTLYCIGRQAIAGDSYPVDNPFTATIVGTPEPLRITQKDLADRQPEYVKLSPKDSQFEKPFDDEYKITLFPQRIIPNVFWYEKGGLNYSIAKHDVKAPLIFIIAGTGASYRASSVKVLQRIFYQVGYHVVAISSPTIPNFMYNASSTVVPGNLEQDSQDIYRVMQRILGQHPDVEVSDYFLTGYSLGASHAAFVSKLDEQEKQFQFKKVLLINPPLSLASSVEILDRMFEENIPGGINRFNEFFDQFIRRVSHFYRKNESLGLGKEFFYEIFRQKLPTEEEMKVMIGFVFRISSSGMVFGADVFNRQGYIVPISQIDQLTPSSTLTDYSKVAHRLGFNDYINHFYLPYYAEKTGMSHQQLIEQSSLESIKEYLKNNTRIGLIHNADDPILAPGEIERLTALFPGRAKIYPNGGHMGNLEFKSYVIDMLEFFNGGFKSEAITVSFKGEMQ